MHEFFTHIIYELNRIGEEEFHFMFLQSPNPIPLFITMIDL